MCLHVTFHPSQLLVLGEPRLPPEPSPLGPCGSVLGLGGPYVLGEGLGDIVGRGD